MTDRVFLHAGVPKSGTTFLQGVLTDNSRLLADAGVLVAGTSRSELVHAAMVVRQDRRLQRLPRRAGQAWDRLVRQVREWPGPDAIISYELFSAATAEQAQAALDDLGPLRVDLVVTARDLTRILPSAWQERLKFALTTPLENWAPPPESDVRSEWGWRTLDPATVAARWGGTLPAERVHIVTVPPDGSKEELWRRFAEACNLTDIDVTIADGHENTSLGPAAAEVLRRVNELSAPPIQGSREQARWLRDVLAHQVLGPLDTEKMGLPPSLESLAVERATSCLTRLQQAGYTWHGVPDDLTPRPRSAVTPGEVETSRLLEIAVKAIWSLLLMVREERQPAAASHPSPPGRWPSLKPLALAEDRLLLWQTQKLQRRVKQLEADLDLSRRMQHRLAMLSDVATHLIAQMSEDDPRRVEDVSQRYRNELF